MKFWTKPVRWQSVLISAVAAFVVSNVALAASWTTVAPWIIVSGTDGTSPQPVKVDSSGSVQVSFGSGATSFTVGGPAVDDAAASGNPVPVGGIYNTTLPTYSNLDRTQLQSGSRGSQHVELWGTDSANPVSMCAGCAVTTVSNNTNRLYMSALGMNHDGSNWNASRSVINATDSTGTGIAAAGLVAQVDDTAPTLPTENQFGNVRMRGGALLVDGQCNQQVAIAVSAAATTQLVALSGTTTIRVCSIKTSISATGSYTLLSGTGSNCGTPANSTGAMVLTSGSPDNWGDGTGVVWAGSAGGELCMTAVTGNLTGVIRYAQY